MSIKASDPILGANRADPDQFFAVFVQPDQKDREYVDAIAKWASKAGVDGAIAYVQFCQETTEPGSNTPGSSVRWNGDKNPAGIAIPLDTTNQPYVIANGDEAARLHIQCLYSLVTRKLSPNVPIPKDWELWFTLVWLPKATDAKAPKVTTLADLNIRYVDAAGEKRATWAWDDQYLAGLLGYARRWLAWVPDVKASATGVVNAWNRPTVDKAITPWTNRNRDGGKLDLARGTLHITFHGTGNPNPGADRKMHGRWQASADAAAIPASVHGYVDDTGFTQTLPFDEIAYHAGDGCNDIATDVGCFRSVAIEICEASTIDHAKANEIACQIACMIVEGDPVFDWGAGATKGKFDYEHFDQHIWVSQETPPHDCPNRIRHVSDPPWTWSYVMSRIDHWAPIVKAALSPTPAPAPQPKPKPTPDLSKLPVPGIPLPPGVTTAYLKRRFAGNDGGTVTVNGQTYTFDANDPLSRAWLRKCLASIPDGKGYEEGQFPALTGAVKRAGTPDNKQGEDYLFSNGWTVPVYDQAGGK